MATTQAKIGNLCRDFRSNTLGLYLSEMSEKTGIKLTTISAFENGSSSNLNHMEAYLKLATQEQKVQFIFKLNDILLGE